MLPNIFGYRTLFRTLYFVIVMLAIAASGNAISAEDMTKVSGVITFKNDMKPSIMKETHGHGFIAEAKNGEYITSQFGVLTEVMVKNSTNEIVGLTKTTPDGKFECLVKASGFYTISFVFNNKPFSKTLSRSDAANMVIDFGQLPFKDFYK